MNRSKQQSRHRVSEPTNRNRTLGITITIYVALVAVTVAVFGQTFRYEFVNFDDDLYVYNSPLIKAGLTTKSLLLAFSAPHARNWHPLTTISHMLDYQLWGAYAGGHHATNVVLHAITVLLLFHVLQKMTGTLWRSALVAALFAIHPLHVESVAWVSERKDVLSALLFVLMISAYVRYVRTPSMARYLLIFLSFAAGLMSKPMLVSAPVILLLLDYWPLDRIGGRTSITQDQKSETRDRWSVVSGLILEKIPLFLLSAASCAVTFMVQKRAVGAIPPLPWSWRIENAIVSYVIYIRQTLWPVRLAVFYPYPNDALPVWQIILALGLLAGTDCGSSRCPPSTTLPVYRLVLVCGNAHAGNWARSSRRTSSCRPIYLPPAYWFVSTRRLGCC